MSSGVVLVTGGTGFVGRAALGELAAAGYEVHALARGGSDRSGIEGVRWHPGDLLDADSLERACRLVAARDPGRASLVHCAAVISYRTRDAALQQAVNVGGTANVVAAARAAGFARFLHVSSVVAVGHARGDEVLDERAPFRDAALGVDYVTTKRAAEELALAARDDVGTVVVNPGAIFGPVSARSNTARFVAAIARERLGPLAPPGGLAVVGVEDVARGLRLALERGRAGTRYLLTESNRSTREIFGLAARRLGVRGPRGSVPRGLWPAVVAGARVLDRVRPLTLAAPQALVMLGLRYRFTSARARAELDWSPRPFPEVLDETLESLAARGVVGPK